MKVYVLIWNDPYEECECGIGISSKEIKGVYSSKKLAEDAITQILTRVSYFRKDFDIEEIEVDFVPYQIPY